MGSNHHADIEVEVLVDNAWWPGWANPDDWRKTMDGLWQCYVRYTSRGRDGEREDRVGYFTQDVIRTVQGLDS